MSKQNDNYNLANMLSKAERRIERLEEFNSGLGDESHRLRIALHEAINRPKGIVPHEAEEFYDQDFYSNNSAQ
jgi:hypothetical protein